MCLKVSGIWLVMGLAVGRPQCDGPAINGRENDYAASASGPSNTYAPEGMSGQTVLHIV